MNISRLDAPKPGNDAQQNAHSEATTAPPEPPEVEWEPDDTGLDEIEREPSQE
jgi:hypothetical protein